MYVCMYVCMHICICVCVCICICIYIYTHTVYKTTPALLGSRLTQTLKQYGNGDPEPGKAGIPRTIPYDDS